MSSCTLTDLAAIDRRRMCGLVAAAAGLSLTGCDGVRRRAKWRLGLSSPHETEILNEFYADMRREIRRDILLGSEFRGPGRDRRTRCQRRNLYVQPQPVAGEECTQSVVLDQYSAGYKLGEYAPRWIVTKQDGRARVGILTNPSDPELAERSRSYVMEFQRMRLSE